MTHLDVLNGSICPIERTHDPVDSVAGITVDTFQAPFIDPLNQKIARSFSRHGL